MSTLMVERRDEFGLMPLDLFRAYLEGREAGFADGYIRALDDLTADAHAAAQGWASAVQIEQRAQRIRAAQAVNR